jgi:uncharacterized protein (UPF0332 family)
MLKSAKALSSARQLLETGDADGACNRAYYAMFDAAQAALLAELPPHLCRKPSQTVRIAKTFNDRFPGHRHVEPQRVKIVLNSQSTDKC